MVQIRHVPEDIHRRLKIRATQSGMTLSEFLLREVSAIANRPTLDEVVDRIRKRRPLSQSVDSAALVRAERESRR